MKRLISCRRQRLCSAGTCVGFDVPYGCDAVQSLLLSSIQELSLVAVPSSSGAVQAQEWGRRVVGGHWNGVVGSSVDSDMVVDTRVATEARPQQLSIRRADTLRDAAEFVCSRWAAGQTSTMVLCTYG